MVGCSYFNNNVTQYDITVGNLNTNHFSVTDINIIDMFKR